MSGVDIYVPAEDHLSAEAASALLRDSIKEMFRRFEKKHRLPRGYGERLQLSGYRP